MYAAPDQLFDRLTAWDNFLNGKDDGPATERDAGNHLDLDVISRDAYITGNPALIARAEYVQELFKVAVLRDNNQMHAAMMLDDAPEPYTRLTGAQGVTMAELDAALAGV
jgi:hypothetical protein